MYLEQVLQKLRNRYFVTITKMVLNLTEYCLSCSVVLLSYPEASNWFHYSERTSCWGGGCVCVCVILAAFQPVPPDTLSWDRACGWQVCKKTKKRYLHHKNTIWSLVSSLSRVPVDKCCLSTFRLSFLKKIMYKIKMYPWLTKDLPPPFL